MKQTAELKSMTQGVTMTDLTNDQKRRLNEALQGRQHMIPTLILYPADDFEAAQRAAYIRDFFWGYFSTQPRLISEHVAPGQMKPGYTVAVPDEAAPDPRATGLLEALSRAGLDAQLGRMPGSWPEPFALFVV